MAYDAREGHLSSSLSCVDLLVALYYGWLRVRPDDPKHAERDRFILSKGHGCTALYAVLADRGFFPVEWLERYGHGPTPLPNHPCVHALPVLECSSGSLGHGLGIATGMAYALKLRGSKARVVALLGDGECNEGSVWEAAMFAAAQQLDNALAIVDNNGIQAVGRSDALAGGASLAAKFASFGWAVRELDGNDIDGVLRVLTDVPFQHGKPSAIVARTRGGAGVSFMDDDVLWHYRVPPADELARALAELDAEPLHRRRAV
jgi:transketolase